MALCPFSLRVHTILRIMTFSQNFLLKWRLDPGKDKSYSLSILALKKAPMVKNSFLSRGEMTERQMGRKNILQILNYSELLKPYTLDSAPSHHLPQCNSTITPEIKVNTPQRYLASGKNATAQQWWLGSSIRAEITQTMTAISQSRSRFRLQHNKTGYMTPW